MIPQLSVLLERSGFTLRGNSRATCAHCSGGDSSTVSYNEKVAHCFRCGWKTGRYKLAQSLGLLREKITEQDRIEMEIEQRKNGEWIRFQGWRKLKLYEIVEKIANLRARAEFAHICWSCLSEEDQEKAWEMFSDLYDQEAALHSAFDFYTCTKVSNWREHDSKIQEVVALWNYERTRRIR